MDVKIFGLILPIVIGRLEQLTLPMAIGTVGPRFKSWIKNLKGVLDVKIHGLILPIVIWTIGTGGPRFKSWIKNLKGVLDVKIHGLIPITIGRLEHLTLPMAIGTVVPGSSPG
ncbi:MAG: hypothetical protein J0H55_04160 [Chitinophagaceae bacterium]|nr:hypothetical protein [Chitinophagaceae bacterium]